jgi:type II secretory pathway component PulM
MPRSVKQFRLRGQSVVVSMTTRMRVLRVSWCQTHLHTKGWHDGGDSWRVGQTAVSTSSLVMWLAKDRRLYTIKIMTPHSTAFSSCILQPLSLFCWGRPFDTTRESPKWI